MAEQELERLVVASIGELKQAEDALRKRYGKLGSMKGRRSFVSALADLNQRAAAVEQLLAALEHR